MVQGTHSQPNCFLQDKCRYVKEDFTKYENGNIRRPSNASLDSEFDIEEEAFNPAVFLYKSLIFIAGQGIKESLAASVNAKSTRAIP